MRAPVKVLVVDDSALIRRMMKEVLSQDPGIEVVGVAPDPFVARERIKKLQPDVITLDVEMPRMDGLTFLSNLMRLRPTPVVMVSSLTERGADVTLRALELGAVDFITKPKLDVAHTFDDLAQELSQKVKAAATAHVRPLASRRMVPPKNGVGTVLPKPTARHYSTTDKVIAIGASTGGTEAIREVLVELPPDAPGIVITQHIPELFSKSFAERLDRESSLVVREATDGQHLLPGHAFVAPGNAHLLLWRDGARYRLRLSDAEPVNRHRPSVDVLFRSVASAAGPNAIGVILTGMGADGAQGLLEMKEAGAFTIAQDEATCVVYGMPREAARMGAASVVLPLDKVAGRMLSAATSTATAGREN